MNRTTELTQSQIDLIDWFLDNYGVNNDLRIYSVSFYFLLDKYMLERIDNKYHSCRRFRDSIEMSNDDWKRIEKHKTKLMCFSELEEIANKHHIALMMGVLVGGKKISVRYTKNEKAICIRLNGVEYINFTERWSHLNPYEMETLLVELKNILE